MLSYKDLLALPQAKEYKPYKAKKAGDKFVVEYTSPKGHICYVPVMGLKEFPTMEEAKWAAEKAYWRAVRAGVI
jgi:hypothetical protein